MKSPFALLFAASALTLLGADAGPASSPGPSASAAPAVVHIASFAYHPSDVTVRVGDSVTFVNNDTVAHTATATDKSFDSGNLDENAKWTYTFQTAGTFRYVCSYHPMMKGTITVKQAPAVMR